MDNTLDNNNQKDSDLVTESSLSDVDVFNNQSIIPPIPTFKYKFKKGLSSSLPIWKLPRCGHISKKIIFKIVLVLLFILSLGGNIVWAYFFDKKIETSQKQQQIIDSKSNCPTCPPEVVCPVVEATVETPTTTVTAPTTVRKTTNSKTSTLEAVTAPPPPPSD